MKVSLSAGEISGDALGAGLYQAFSSMATPLEAKGIVGTAMTAAGVAPMHHIDSLSVMGIFEVMKRLPQLYALKKQWVEENLAWHPDVFVGIDAPDFNLRVAKSLKCAGIKTVQYVSPSVWAWRPGRLKGICEATDLVLCLLPFETDIYEQAGHKAVYVGHPMASEIPREVDTRAAKRVLDLHEERPCIVLMPGSRLQEYRHNLIPFLETAELCAKAMPGLSLLLPVAKPALHKALKPYREMLAGLGVKVLDGQAREAIAACDAALVASGTATLEVALHKKPMVIAYCMNSVNAMLAKHLVKVPHFGLPNLLVGERVVPEYFQEAVLPSAMAKHLITWCAGVCPADIMSAFEHIHEMLSEDTSTLAAQAIVDLSGRG